MKALIVVGVIVVLWAISLSAFLANAEHKKAAAPGNGPEYALDTAPDVEESPLRGKRVLFLGSSVTYGAASQKVSFVDYLAKQDGVQTTKDAVSGTTLVDEWSFYSLGSSLNAGSYIKRLKAIDQKTVYDAVVVQLSTNDASQNKPLGEVSADRDLETFDVHTVTGAMEYIISYSQKTWGCPVVFYTGSYYENDAYAAMVDRLYDLQDKWGIDIIDMYGDESFNDISESDYALYMWDPIHPTRAGYLRWWTPFIRQHLGDILGKLGLIKKHLKKN